MVKDQIIKEIRDALENTIMNIWIQDIFSDENLKGAYENNINVLIMPRIIMR